MVFATEACQIADMIQVGCMLSRNGVADYCCLLYTSDAADE